MMIIKIVSSFAFKRAFHVIGFRDVLIFNGNSPKPVAIFCRKRVFLVGSGERKKSPAIAERWFHFDDASLINHC